MIIGTNLDGKMRVPHSFSVFLLMIIFLQGTYSDIPDFTPEMEEQIISFVEATMACRDVPGAILSIVHKGDVVMHRGFGVTDLESMEPMTENTLFPIGSVTKTFTSTLISILLEESNGMYTWDTPLFEIFGDDFRLTDEIRTDYATIRDILSHKVNLYTYSPTLLTLFPDGRESLDMCSRMNTLEAAAGFRTEFIYDNLMFMLAGCVAEMIGGQPYRELLRTRILEPLNMTSSFLSSELSDFTPIPSSYIFSAEDQALLEIDKDILYLKPVDPAGALISTAVDMSNWMLTQLTSFTEGSDLWKETHQPSNVVTAPFLSFTKPTFPFHFDSTTYGLGWFLGNYQGYKLVYHTGSIAGFVCNLGLYPGTETSVFFGVNSLGNNTFGFGLSTPQWYIADILMGEVPFLNETTSCTFPEPWIQIDEFEKNNDELGSRQSSEMSDDFLREQHQEMNDWVIENYEYLIGDYGHPLFGNFSIGFNETRERLTFTQGRNGEGSLVPIDVEEPVERKNFHLAFEGNLYNLFRALDINFLPVYFDNFENERYQDFAAVGYEPNSPPMFVRDLEW